MMWFQSLLAQIDPTEDLLNQSPNRFLGIDTTDTLVILGFLVLMIIALFSWAYFIRKRPNVNHGSRVLVRPPRRSRKSRHRSRSVAPQESDRKVRVRRRRRRRRRSEDGMPRNPTLGETGGLPPLRPEEPESPPPAQSPS